MPPSRWSRFGPRLTAAERRARARSALAGLSGERPAEPVVVEGRGPLARTFWGQAWCDNLESYADFAYRLERGRSYLRAGAVVDLAIEPGVVQALVSGSELYRVKVGIPALAERRWRALARRCTGRIGSLVGLLRGELPDEVLQAVTDRADGLFPEPGAMEISCTCPDRATVCKHVAATLYGVGTRLDSRPELLFHLRGVNPEELTARATAELARGTKTGASRFTPLARDADLSALFGINLGDDPELATPPAAPAKPPRIRKRRR